EHQSAATDRAWFNVVVVGVSKRRRLWSNSRAAISVCARPTESRPILFLLRARAHRDDRILGDALAQHSGFFALRLFAARSNRRPGARFAADDGALFV